MGFVTSAGKKLAWGNDPEGRRMRLLGIFILILNNNRYDYYLRSLLRYQCETRRCYRFKK